MSIDIVTKQSHVADFGDIDIVLTGFEYVERSPRLLAVVGGHIHVHRVLLVIRRDLDRSGGFIFGGVWEGIFI